MQYVVTRALTSSDSRPAAVEEDKKGPLPEPLKRLIQRRSSSGGIQAIVLR